MKLILACIMSLLLINLRAQTIVTFAGNGSTIFSGDGGPATSAGIPEPKFGIFDRYGNYYFSDGGVSGVRKIDTFGIITTIAGNGIQGYSGDSGLATNAMLNSPIGLTFDIFGNLYICDQGNDRIRKVDTSGIITTIAGTGVNGFAGDNGLAINAKFYDLGGICSDKFGNLYIVDIFNYRIRKIDTSGIITTFAGTGTMGYPVDGIPATAEDLDFPISVAADSAGNIYIADGGTFSSRVRKVNNLGIITTVAGNGSYTYSGDNVPATIAQIAPYIIGFDNLQNLFIGDQYNSRVYKVDLDGMLLNVAGNGIVGFSGDNGPATAAELEFPSGVAMDRCNNLYICEVGAISGSDSVSNIRKVIFNPSCFPEKLPTTTDKNITLHPNPAVNELYVENVRISGQYVLFNITGIIEQTGTLQTGNNRIDISNLPMGLYILMFTTKDGQQVVRKVVKE